MLSLVTGSVTDPPLSILCLGAHSDDIEIGAGGTILTLLRRFPGSHVHWVVLSALAERAREARASANVFLGYAGASDVRLLTFRDGFFPAQFEAIKEAFEMLKGVRPNLVLTHHRSDHHQDHRVVAELTWNTFRNHLILEYEIPKYDPDLGNPNLFVPITSEDAQAKVTALMSHFASQHGRTWFTPDTFLGLMRIRGVQAAAASGLAEAFYAPKLRLLG
ncbi:MAG: PIG-L family deacetylase [Alphaproteobacteria bacterium]|nr:PIG-L family deacetylase [Alphaproteobacteria bacterium]